MRDGLTTSQASATEASAQIDEPSTDDDVNIADFLAPPQADNELGRLGKYRILKFLGRGGMGVVFQAEDPKLKRNVAIKAMLPSLAASARAGKRFLREAQAMAAVKHDSVVTIYDVDEQRGVPFLAMELLRGETLEQRLQREGPLPLAQILRIGREIASGLAAAHATGLIHRDIKPSNIWLETTGRVHEAQGSEASSASRTKILDFGLARATAASATAARPTAGESGLTQQGVIVGTPAFMSPEQARGEAVDTRSDLFSLGVVLYRLCSGQLPFRGKNAPAMLLEVTTHEPPAPTEVKCGAPPALSELVMKLLEKNPARRFASADELAAALESLEKQLLKETPTLLQAPILPQVTTAAGPVQMGLTTFHCPRQLDEFAVYDRC